MFLDYDGTLSPIVDDPDRAIMSDAVRTTTLLLFWMLSGLKNYFAKCLFSLYLSQMRAAVKDVAKYFPTAIISGRSRDKVRPLNLYQHNQTKKLKTLNSVEGLFMCQVYELVGLTELYYAGSHGMDIMTPANVNGSPEDTNSDQQVKFIVPQLNYMIKQTLLISLFLAFVNRVKR